MGFVSGSGSLFKGNVALVAKVAKVVSTPSSLSTNSWGVVAMKNETTTGGYTSVLAELYQSNDDLEKINKDMDGLGDLLKNNKLYEFLVLLVMDGDKKKTILKALVDDAKFSDVTLNFMNLLVDKKCIELIKDVIKEFKSTYNKLTDTKVKKP